MEYWDVVVVIIAIVGLIVTVTKPIIALSSKITELITKLDNLERSMQANSAEHAEINRHLNEADTTLADHEARINILETHKP